jgi:hypothetical protein
LTAQALVAKADSICRKLRASVPKPPTSQDLGVIARYAQQSYGPAQQAVRSFRGLKPPAAERSLYDQFVTAAARRTEDVRLLETAAQARNASGVKAAGRKQAQDALPYQLAARQLGFRVCGSGGTAPAKGR